MSVSNEELHQQALVYLKRGFSVIPVGKDKKPMFSWEKYQTQRPTEDELANWFFEKNPAGIAIVTGAISGIVVLDVEVDGDTSGLDIPATLTAKTGGSGRHHYFRHPGHEVKNRVRIQERKIDLRGDGGFVVAPPSRSIKGEYEWLTELDTPLAEMPSWLKLREVIDKSHVEYSSRLRPEVSKWEKIIYGVSEGGRHDALVRLIGKLQAHLPKNNWDDLLMPVIELWNGQNDPPLSDDEIHTTYEDLRARYDNGEPAPRKQRPLYSTSELLEHEPAEYQFLVEPFVPYQAISAVSGHPGSGKSWVTLHLAKCVASGEPMFGRFKTTQGNVLILDEESGLDELHKRARKLGFTEDLPIFFHVLGGFKLDNADDLDELLATVEKHNIKLVILDPFVAFHSKTENSAEEIQQITEAMQRFLAIGAAVLYVHHHRKDSVAKFGYGQGLRGSSALLGRLDSHVVVKKLSSDEVSDELEIIHEKSRRSKNATAFKVSLVEENGKVSFTDTADVEPAKLKVEQAKEAIITMLEAGGEMTRKDIIAAVKQGQGVGSKNTSDALLALGEEKLIVEARRGREKFYRRIITGDEE